MIGASGLSVHLAWFERGIVTGRALGICEDILWPDLIDVIVNNRRTGEKDGTALSPTRYEPEAGKPRVVHRVNVKARAKTAVAIDIETSKKTGEIPPPPQEIRRRLAVMGLAGIFWTSHNHLPDAMRGRLLLPLSAEINPDLPVIEIMAEKLDLAGVYDTSKCGPAAIFYAPSAACSDDLDHHEAFAVDGATIDASLLAQEAGALAAERRAELECQAADAAAEAERRRQERLATGTDPDASLIEQIRLRLDLRAILAAHGYDKRKGKGDFWRHPNSTLGVHGLNIKLFAGIERVYSHNATDPLHYGNLPEWCGIKAPDAFDVIAVLQFGGDRQRVFLELGRQFGI